MTPPPAIDHRTPHPHPFTHPTLPHLMQAQEEATPPPVRDESQRLQCRFYEEQYPNPESMVMVKVMNIADMAAEVILLEYNDIEVGGWIGWVGVCGDRGGTGGVSQSSRVGWLAGGVWPVGLGCHWSTFTFAISINESHQPHQGMILHSELSRRRIRSIKKLIRVNKLEVFSVLRVDKDKGACVRVIQGMPALQRERQYIRMH